MLCLEYLYVVHFTDNFSPNKYDFLIISNKRKCPVTAKV